MPDHSPQAYAGMTTPEDFAGTTDVNPVKGFDARRKQLVGHVKNPLYRNGYALMLNTGMTSILGFLFWILAARLYTPSEVGRSSAQISAMALISTLSQLNLTSMVTRFLARAGSASHTLVVKSYAIAAAATLFSSTAALVIAHFVTPKANVLHVTVLFGAWFVISTVFWSIFTLQDSVLTGLRRTVWIPLENGVFGVSKLLLLIVFAGIFGAHGIYASWTVPLIITLIPVNYVIFKMFIPSHMKNKAHNEQPLNRRLIAKYIAGDYISSLFGPMLTTFLPVLVINVLDAKAAGYFYIAQIIGTGLDLIAYNLGNSLMVEVADQESRIVELSRAVLRRSFMLVIPLGTVLFIGAPVLLGLFNHEYASNSTTLLRLLIISTIPKILVALHATLTRVMHRTHRNAVVSGLAAVMTITGSVVGMQHFGINGVGYAMIGSQCITTLMVLPWVLRILRGDAVVGRHHR